MFFQKSLVLVFAVFVFCESAFVDNLNKCKINDGHCQKDLLQIVLKDIGKSGIPELGIPKVDPIQLKNVSVAIKDLLDITLIEGSVKGIKDCIVEKVVTNIEKRHSSVELLCDKISVKGKYKVFSSSPAIKSLFGADAVQGEGNGKVKIEKLFLKLDFVFFVQKVNGVIFIKWKTEKSTYAYDIKGKISFFADNLYIGKQESSKLVTGLLNENWASLASLGTPFMDKAIEYLNEFLHKFSDTVPTSYYCSDDLSSYAINE